MLNHISGAVSGALDGPPPPVRAKSVRAGNEERVPISRKQVGALLKTAEDFARTTGEPGRPSSSLGRPALAVLAALGRLVDYATGALFPDHDKLCEETGYSRRSVVRALNQLRTIGFVRWVCRYVETGLGRRFGPQVRQTSNGYVLSMPQPERLAQLAAEGHDHEARTKAQRAERQAQRKAKEAEWREMRDRKRTQQAERAVTLAAIAAPMPAPTPAPVPRVDRAADLERFNAVLASTGLFGPT